MPDSRVGRNGQGQWTAGNSGNAGGNPRRAGYVEALRKMGRNGENFEEVAAFLYAVMRADVDALKPLLPESIKLEQEGIDALVLALAVPKIQERIAAANEIRGMGVGKHLDTFEAPSEFAGQSDADVLAQLLDSVPSEVLAAAQAKRQQKPKEAH